MSSVISVAAQAPNDVSDLESLSFKAFHKGVESRFSVRELTAEELTAQQEAANDRAAAAESARIQQMERQGEVYSRNLQRQNNITSNDICNICTFIFTPD